MHAYHVAIVGGGLAGLYAAWQLEQAGVEDYLVIEARDLPGGRIASLELLPLEPGATQTHKSDAPRCFDLGPAWYWPGLQPQLDALVRALGLEAFAQHEAGDMVFEHAAGEAPRRMPGYASSPPSMRLKGGMGALIGALRRRIPPGRVVTGQAVSQLRYSAGEVALESQDVNGRFTRHGARHVLLAVPPRLAVARIGFSPVLPDALARQWSAASTWMAPHAKYLAVFDAPFWRDNGLSGEGRSLQGPLGEIHDASLPGGEAALFGFFAIPAQVRRSLTEEVLRTHCRAQLVRLFGAKAAMPKLDVVKDWARESWTATDADLVAEAGHGAVPPAGIASGPWRGRILGIASEWSPRFPGYLAGAIEAAELGVRAVLGTRGQTSSREHSDANVRF
ncbi:flavin monoamine oxidase family protein [Luteimonas mephitis]|uniref:flavin monoamine oxidase family protein n=1 Tax=Luteimonas mephitis TaxID=83615 RepID=UPI000567934B|nr:FAD-dependent oxidoreductase [Luteimonas mephitis]